MFWVCENISTVYHIFSICCLYCMYISTIVFICSIIQLFQTFNTWCYVWLEELINILILCNIDVCFRITVKHYRLRDVSMNQVWLLIIGVRQREKDKGGKLTSVTRRGRERERIRSGGEAKNNLRLGGLWLLGKITKNAFLFS